MEKSDNVSVAVTPLEAGNWTRQQLFSNAWNGFEKQNWVKSADTRNYCLYRGPAGARCAIGWSILDEWYKPEMEGKGLDDNIRKIAHISPYDAKFVRELQDIHDGWGAALSLEERKDSMRDFAEYWGLKVPE